MTQFLCAYPWLQLSTESEESLRVCCYGESGKVVLDNNKTVKLSSLKDPNDFLNNSFYKDIRKSMLNNEIPSFCKGCEKLELNGGESPRTIMNNVYKDKLSESLRLTREDGYLESPKVNILELTLGNVCNLKCRMCSPFFSNLLKSDFNKLNISYDEKAVFEIESSFKDIETLKETISKLDSLELLSFLGGEPLIHPLHLDILKHLVETKKSNSIELRYNSNLVTLDKRVTEIWKEFKKVKLSVSLEASGSLNDYIRYPSSFEEVSKNINSLINLRNNGVPLDLSITSVFQAYSVPGTIDFLKWLSQYKDDFPIIPHFIYLDFPHYLSAEVLPQSIKVQLAREINDFVNSNKADLLSGKFKMENEKNLNILLHFLEMYIDKGKEQFFMDFTVFTKKLDKIRDVEGFFERYPDLFGGQIERS
ncbi:MAG: radical SAM protein [Bacteriovoracaceae bacterium]|nr:radical SAM protein [Bacteriovoracaceae bacterium]